MAIRVTSMDAAPIAQSSANTLALDSRLRVPALEAPRHAPVVWCAGQKGEQCVLPAHPRLNRVMQAKPAHPRLNRVKSSLFKKNSLFLKKRTMRFTCTSTTE